MLGRVAVVDPRCLGQQRLDGLEPDVYGLVAVAVDVDEEPGLVVGAQDVGDLFGWDQPEAVAAIEVVGWAEAGGEGGEARTPYPRP